MRSLRPVGTIFIFGALLGGFSACTSVLLNTPVSKRSEGWIVTLNEVKEGPDEYAADGVAQTPDKGEKFVWTLLTVRSEIATEEMFSYDACVLEGKGVTRPPEIVDRHVEVPSPADRNEAFTSGQEKTRLLIYRYPKEQHPTRMKCGKIELPIPGKS
jgi:hypothetical protein